MSNFNTATENNNDDQWEMYQNIWFFGKMVLFALQNETHRTRWLYFRGNRIVVVIVFDILFLYYLCFIFSLLMEKKHIYQPNNNCNWLNDNNTKNSNSPNQYESVNKLFSLIPLSFIYLFLLACGLFLLLKYLWDYHYIILIWLWDSYFGKRAWLFGYYFTLIKWEDYWFWLKVQV